MIDTASKQYAVYLTAVSAWLLSPPLKTVAPMKHRGPHKTVPIRMAQQRVGISSVRPYGAASTIVYGAVGIVPSSICE